MAHAFDRKTWHAQPAAAPCLSFAVYQVLVDDHMLLNALLAALFLHGGDVLVLKVDDTLIVACLLHFLQVVRDGVELVCLLGRDGLHSFQFSAQIKVKLFLIAWIASYFTQEVAQVMSSDFSNLQYL